MFISILAQLEQAQQKNTIDIYNYVRDMRKQRPSMVLNEVKYNIYHFKLFRYYTFFQIQYIFIHDALLEAINQGMIKDVGVENPYVIQ